MKIKLLLLLVLLSSMGLSAQNLGINTPIPLKTFSVNGTIAVDHSNKNFGTLDSASLIFGTPASVGISSNKSMIGANIQGLDFWTSSSRRMVIGQTGNVGVGTSLPLSKFHIGSGTDVSLITHGYLMLGNEVGQNMAIDNNEIQARNNGAFSTLFLQHNGGVLQVGATSDNNLRFDGVNVQAMFNGGSNELILNGINGGKIRLGSNLDFANTKLHISTGVDAGLTPAQSGFMMIGPSNGENVVFDNNEILARNNGVATTLYLGRDGSKVQLGNGSEASGTKLHITSGNDVGLTDALSGHLMLGSQAATNMIFDQNEIQARNNAAASHLYLQNGGGNVFIGDAANFTNSHRLGVDGNAVVTGALRVGNTVTPAGFKLAVDGKAICTELLVRLVPNWPDFVFNNNYNLPGLNEVEEFIKKNNHLPGIPSAKSIEENGMNIGEMLKLQMQKIEEHTLYIIELKKEIEKMKALK